MPADQESIPSTRASRVAALAGDQRLADYRAIDAVRSEFANSDGRTIGEHARNFLVGAPIRTANRIEVVHI